MKTILDLPAEVLAEAERLAHATGVPLETLVEKALRTIVRHHRRRPFALRSASFRGEGLSPEFRNAGWSDILKTVNGS